MDLNEWFVVNQVLYSGVWQSISMDLIDSTRLSIPVSSLNQACTQVQYCAIPLDANLPRLL